MAGGTRALSLAAGGLALAVVLALVFGTLGALAVHAGGGVALRPGDWAAVRFTLLQASLSAVLSCALAVPFARALMRREFPGRGLALSLLGAPFLLPVIVAVLGLLAVWGRSGLVSEVSQALGGGRISIYGLTGVVLAHVFFNLPLVTRLLVQGWQDIPAERFRLAAQLGMTPGAVVRLLEAPMLRGVLPGAFVLVFLLCMTSFAVALALGGGPRATTVELAIYQALRFDFELGRAALLALIQFGLCGAVAVAALALGRTEGFGRGLGRLPRRWDAPGGVWRWLDAGVMAAAALFLLLPMGFVVGRGGLALLAGLPPGLLAAAGTSLGLALCASAAAVAAALALSALILSLPGRPALGVEALGILMLAASPFVVGTGLFLLLRPVADPFAWALAVTGVINAAMGLPFALRALVPALAGVERNYGRLSASLGMTGWARFRLVTLPLIRRPLGFSAGLAAALSAGDLGIITLFAPPGVETLPLYMYRLMGAYRMDDAAGAALVLLAMSLALFRVFDGEGGLEIRFDAVRFERPGFALDLDLALKGGAVTALVGPSGSGKSTVLDLVAGFETPRKGRVLIGGADMTGVGPAARPVSMVFQDNNLFPHLSVEDNVGLGLDPGLRLSPPEREEVARVLREVGLAGQEDKRPGQLSGGQQSRAALARALLRDRPVLLLDEPFSALGPGLRQEMMRLVAALAQARGLTVAMVTHDPEDALTIAAETALVAEGRVAPPVATRALFDDPPPALAAYLGRAADDSAGPLR